MERKDSQGKEVMVAMPGTARATEHKDQVKEQEAKKEKKKKEKATAPSCETWKSSCCG